jgi:hypothetical protein
MKSRVAPETVDKRNPLLLPEIESQSLNHAACTLFTRPTELSGGAEEDHVISAGIIALWAATQPWDLPDMKY